MINLKQIEGTLKYGQFDGTKLNKIIIAYTAFTALIILGLFGLIIALTLEQVNKINPMPIIEFCFLIICVSICFLILPITFLVLILRNEKIRKEINLWLQDAVELGAFCEMLLPDYTDEPLNQIFSLPTRVKIRVKFKYNGKHYSKDSGYKNKNGEFKNDYQAIWIKYADKSINIIYSPKYDEVIILKNNQ